MSLKLMQRASTSPLALPVAALAALFMFFISETSYDRAALSLQTLTRMAEARTNAQVLLRGLLDAESGQRGYLLSGRTEYLVPYGRALTEVGDSLQSLKGYYRDEPEVARLVAQIEQRVAEKLSELATLVQLKTEGRDEAWRELFLSNIGKERMDAVRAASDQLLALETQRVADERERIRHTVMVNRIGVSALTALSLLALFMYLRQTAALDRQRNGQQREVQAERDRLEVEVKARTVQLTELARHLQTAREDERSRLARDLHDELGALLTAAKLDAARLKSRLGAALTPEAAQRLAHLNDTLNSGIALKRRIIEDLRPSSLSNLGLVAALDIQSREFGQRANIPVETEFDEVDLTPAAELTVYRLVQEALTNIAKYAKPQRIRITLHEVDGQAEIAVQDDGIGFDTSVPRMSAHGLLGMRYRVEAEGGVMLLESAPGRGTLVRALMPLVPLVPLVPLTPQPPAPAQPSPAPDANAA